MDTKITSASVKVMLSYDYCHFESSMSIENESGLTMKDWSIENCLVLFEKFNGMGYKKRKIPSPYLWSFTDQYSKGKFVLDGKFDSNAVSKQPGTGAIMKGMGITA